MLDTLFCSGLPRYVAVLVALLGCRTAHAAFNIYIDSTLVATNDGSAGSISFVGVVNGYSYNIQAVAEPSGALTSSLQVVEVNRRGANPTVTISGTFDQQAGSLGTHALLSSLSRGLVEDMATSGNVRMVTEAASGTGGGVGSTPVIALSAGEEFDTSEGTFNRTSEFYTLTQRFDIGGLGNDKAVFLRASSELGATGEGPLFHNPAPSSVILLVSGAGFLLCFVGARRWLGV